MAYQTGTASNHVDLLDKLVAFLSTNSTLVGLGQEWEVLRYAGCKSIEASSFLVNYEPFAAVKGPYHQHANGWLTANGEHLNSWFKWTMTGPEVISRIGLMGAADATRSPKNFKLQWLDADDTTWVDKYAWSDVTWTASEYKEWVLPDDALAGKTTWRILITANNGSANYSGFQELRLPVFQVSADFDRARMPAAWLKAPGMTGADPVYVNFQIYDRPTSDYYNLAVTGATGFVNDADFDNQPGALTAMAMPLWNQPIKYWFHANGQRVVVAVKIESAYLTLYAGKILPYGTPGQYPYPLLIGAPLPTASATRYSSTDSSLAFKGARANMKLRNNAGQWVMPSAWPYMTNLQFRDTNGQYPLLPVTLLDASNTYGTLDGINHVTGFSNNAENTVTAGSEVHLVLQDGLSNGINDHFTMRAN